MSGKDFKPRQPVKQNHSDNPKTARNRAAEASKRGFKAGELKAKSAYRVNKSRALRKLHKTPEWNIRSPTEQDKLERDAMEPVEEKFALRMEGLRREWDRKLVEDDFDSDEEPTDDGDLNTDDVDMVESVDIIGSDGPEDGWEDVDGMEGVDETIAEVIKDSERGWNVKLGRWAKMAEIEEKRDSLKL
jgi:hypothetical protein